MSTPATESPLAKVRRLFGEHMALDIDDLGVVDFVLATVVAVWHPCCQEIPWGYIVSPPGSGKTEATRPLKDYPGCIFVSSPTENALISGHKSENGEDPSLIALLDKKTIVIKDLTPVISGNPQKTAKILGDYRDAFDGFCSKASGTAGLRSYEATFGVLAAVTDMIDKFTEDFQQLGERFLTFRMNRIQHPFLKRREHLRHVTRAMPHKDKWRKVLADAMIEAIEDTKKTTVARPLPAQPEEIETCVLTMADVVAQLRTSTVGGNATSSEVATRLSQQLTSLAAGRIYCDDRNEWNEDDLSFIRRICIDTLSLPRRRVAMALYYRFARSTDYMTANQIANKCSGVTVHSVLDFMTQWVHVGLVDKFILKSTSTYRLSPEGYESLHMTGMFDPGPHFPSHPSNINKGEVLCQKKQ